jgi:hypothetical protein
MSGRQTCHLTVVKGAGEPEVFVTCPVEISGNSYSGSIGDLVYVPFAINHRRAQAARRGLRQAERRTLRN